MHYEESSIFNRYEGFALKSLILLENKVLSVLG